ncbi:hypothetical protein L596_024050 [Steinernema carpocapsae]|uniref:RNA helicase n=1 Tax=Steinernema carpocapsae TaxID=34508 RepID=A0A4U5MG94_STECR|nr:hypothetical protein L596_024050 [Steinernema carpocapsae]
MEDLERLVLQSRICVELENHLGEGQKIIAEFVVGLAEQNSTFGGFRKALEENGVGQQFKDSLGEEIPKEAKPSLSIQKQLESLPIFSLRESLLQVVSDNQVLFMIGETGSGKTTQMTQYLMEAGFGSRGHKIGCTQPRRVAATSVAKRVSEEFGCRLGQEVRYTIGFDDYTSPDTCLADPDLKSYSCILLDEAYERTISMDVLFGLLQGIVKRRKDLKLIVTSAILDAVKFSEYFFEAPIFTIPGRTFPVDILYSKEPELDYLDAALTTVMQIHLTEPQGDILVFLSGKEEIATSCEILHGRIKKLGNDAPELIILVYSALPSEMQAKIFEPAPSGSRNVVIATNIAEKSLMIDGIYVSALESLLVTPNFQAEAKQRSGRAGRIGPGKCFRIYTERAHRNEMLPTPVPEIERVNLATTLLQLKALGINNFLEFDFMDAPSFEASTLQALYTIAALDEDGLLTRLRRRMAEFPLDPTLSKLLIKYVDLSCSEEILTIVSMLSKHRHFSPTWCHKNFVQHRHVKRAQEVRKQLLGVLYRLKLDVVSCGRDVQREQKTICSGFFRNAAKRDPQGGYRTLVGGQQVHIHSSSSLFKQ